jgi:GDPmannose 4,6-dehydratase
VKKKFFVIGVNGQDGKYLSEIIIKSKNKVLGIGRQNRSKYFKDSKYFNYKNLDLENSRELDVLLRKFEPDYVINFAAMHGSSEKMWNNNLERSIKINTIPTKIILDYISNKNSNCFYFYASSMRCLRQEQKISEISQRINFDFYQITKNLSEILINNYRKKFNIKASVCWFFQHESKIRKKDFFIPKIVNILKKSIKDRKYYKKVDNLDFYCDWGSAEEYMSIVMKLISKRINQDFVIGTGNTLKGNIFVKELFKKYGLNYKDHVGVKNKKKISSEKFKADISKLKSFLKIYPIKNIYNVCEDMLMSNNKR